VKEKKIVVDSADHMTHVNTQCEQNGGHFVLKRAERNCSDLKGQ